MYGMLRVVEAEAECLSAEKALKLPRRYSFLLISTSYAPQHIILSVTTIHEISAHLFPTQNLCLFVMTHFHFVRGQLRAVNPVGKSFTILPECVWTGFGLVHRFDTATRRFTGEVTTDGVSVSVLLTKPAR